VIGLTILVVGPVAAIALATGAAGGGAAPASASVPALSVPAVHVPSIPPAHLDVTAATPTPVPQASAPAAPPQVMYQPVTPTPAPTSTTAQIVAIITAAAETYGVDPGWMISTATCESNLRPDAYNPSGPYVGIFQFLPSTFAAHGGTDIWDPVQQSEIAASMFAGGDSSAWPVCSLR
jgi:soluble lytic murein transglycosylase-like protein